MLTRYQDWPIRLEHFIVDRKKEPFHFGTFDCCLAVCDAVKEMTGIDIGESFRGYNGKDEADIVLEKNGGVEGIAEHVSKHYDIEEIGVPFAGRGDICLVDYEEQLCLGIVFTDGRNIFAPHFPGGWGSVPIMTARRAWRI